VDIDVQIGLPTVLRMWLRSLCPFSQLAVVYRRFNDLAK